MFLEGSWLGYLMFLPTTRSFEGYISKENVLKSFYKQNLNKSFGTWKIKVSTHAKNIWG